MSLPASHSDVLAAARGALEASLVTHGLDARVVTSICDATCPLIGSAIEQGLSFKRGNIAARRSVLAAVTAETAADKAAEHPVKDIDDVAVSIAEVVSLALDAAFDSGTFEDVDGEVMSRGLALLLKATRDLLERDPGNLDARALRAEKNGKPEVAARLRRAAARIRARG